MTDELTEEVGISTENNRALTIEQGAEIIRDPVYAPKTSNLPATPKKTPKIRHSGHLVDQKLKYNNPQNKQLTLFDILDPTIKGLVEKYEVTSEGIQLSPGEDKLLNAIYSLLKEKSESNDQNSDKFYQGNYEASSLVIFGGEQVKPPHLRVIPAELYKAYVGHNDYSGRDIEDINATLKSISQKQFLMKYDRVRKIKKEDKTENRTDRIERCEKLIEIVRYTRDMTDDELAKLNNGDLRISQTKGELIIALNPILTDQIHSKYVEYPQDINRRTIIASGGAHSVTIAINRLRDYFLREISSKRHECQINVETLPFILKLDKYVKQGRRKLLKESIEKAIQACVNLGLLRDWSLEPGAQGQLKYIFKLNMNFE